MIDGKNGDISSFLGSFPAVNQTAATGNITRENLGKMVQPLEVVPGDRHAGFNFNGEKIRSVHDQQVNFVTLAVPIKKRSLFLP